MSLRLDQDGTIVLHGDCLVDEAEPLHRMLLSDPAARVDWTQCNHLHSAILQLILAARPTVTPRCGDSFVDRWISGQY
jgi:hypothetical protein